MPSEQTEKVRRRAYEIWEREGRPDGREAEHWRMGVMEIEREASGADDTQEVPAMRVTETAPTADEVAAWDPSGRGQLTEKQERAEQVSVASEADPLGLAQRDHAGDDNLSPDERTPD